MRPDIVTDVLVIGSGAGGGVVAYHLARAGERVIVLERGPRVESTEMDSSEMRSIGRLYKDGGSQTNTDGDMFVLQGSCVGGSTVLTNGVCFRLPEDVRRGWANQGFEVRPDALLRSYERVERAIGVRPLDPRRLNSAADLMARGARGYGTDARGFDKNFARCLGCGGCNLGCRHGRKMDSLTTWIPMAESHGAEVLALCSVDRVIVEKGRAAGVEARDLRDGTRFRVRARRTVLAAGAIGTPEILLKSGLAPATAGKRTSFNVGSLVAAEFAHDIDAFEGDQMGVHIEGDGWLAEQDHNPPTAFAMTLPGWYDRHATDMNRYRRLTAAGVLVPTPDTGQVFLGIGRRLMPRLFDHAEVRFRASRSTLSTLADAITALCRVFLAAGAVRVLPPTGRAIEVREPADADRIAGLIRSQADVTGFGSAHPMGGAVSGDDPRRTTVDPSFAVRGVPDLFVADASVFPGSTRVNPQLTVMAVADAAVRSIGGFEPDPVPDADLVPILRSRPLEGARP